MIFNPLKNLTKAVDPTGLTTKVVETTERATEVTVGGAKSLASGAASVVADPIGSAEVALETVADLPDTGMRLIEGFTEGAEIAVGGVLIEIDTKEAAELVYNVIVPKTAQAVLRGEMPDREDFQEDAIAWVGGPIQGIYVAANSQSATMIARGMTPSAEQVGRDMVAALTPVALSRLGL